MKLTELQKAARAAIKIHGTVGTARKMTVTHSTVVRWCSGAIKTAKPGVLTDLKMLVK